MGEGREKRGGGREGEGRENRRKGREEGRGRGGKTEGGRGGERGKRDRWKHNESWTMHLITEVMN